ncbi:MAG: hypothetical protein M3Q76_08665, partial [Acidobacteriota bacterium]|nr:hypothetical protein [Acidobacteriota bacterium]
QRGCRYPDKHLAGVGVAFKLAHALLRERGREHLVKSFLNSSPSARSRRWLRSSAKIAPSLLTDWAIW